MPSGELTDRRYFAKPADLASAVAQFTATCLHHALLQKPAASMVLPGGTTPRLFLPEIAGLDLPWQRIQLTLSDERWVSTTANDSNERLLHECFLQHLPIAPCFSSLKTDHAHPGAAIEVIDTRLAAMPLPFDLVILGMGEDGHIASLFPGMPLDAHDAHLCQVAAPPIAPSLRISLGFRALIEAGQIAFVILGKNKRQRLNQLLSALDGRIPFVKLLQHRPVTVFESDTQSVHESQGKKP